MNFKKTFLPLINPLSKDNPVIVQVLGICSALRCDGQAWSRLSS